MKRIGPRALLAFPFVFVAVAFAVIAGVPESARPGAIAIAIEIVKASALAGLAAGALAFDRGEYLRRGWGLSAACYFFLLLRDTWIFFGPSPAPAWVEIGRALLVLLANVAMVAGTWILARASSIAGLDAASSPRLRSAILAIAVFLALLCAGPAVALDVRYAMADLRAGWALPSDLGDMLALPLIAPLLLTAIAVRGGTLRWTWRLLTASLLAWLLYDGVLSLLDVLHVDAAVARRSAECFRMFAGTLACSAGLAQRRAVLYDDE